MQISDSRLKYFIEAVKDRKPVTGFTHDFYNYPARFSPLFAREAIKTFSRPGDLIIDPFMGGGTTLIESKLLNRHCIGFDISSLAYFIAQVKSNPLNSTEIKFIHRKLNEIIAKMKCSFPSERPLSWIENGYQRNISYKDTWRIRKLMEQFINEVEQLQASEKIQNFFRCALLKTGQWALDSKKEISSVDSFREKLTTNIIGMCTGSLDFYKALNKIKKDTRTLCFNGAAYDIVNSNFLQGYNSPKLILTSPPYPGIHVVYHRWQIHGKKETPAPFWIANSLDGHGLTHYSMGNRQQKGLESYFSNIHKTFSAIKNICSKQTLIVQMLAFSDATWQLPKYLDVMKLAGFKEVHYTSDRLWRTVPNRKWYASKKGKTESSHEVVLFHKLVS